MISFNSSLYQHSQPYARFNGGLYYRIEGDQAVLGANVDIINRQLFGYRNCRLQLWACQSPFNGGVLDGIKIAERPVGLDEQASDAEANATTALLPAGRDDYLMVMTLVGTDEYGATELLDHASFDIRQAFTQPAMQGSVQFELTADCLDFSVESVFNPREADNVSGTLCLELWALDQPYRGGAFAGIRLAATGLGTLAGGFALLHNRFRLDLEAQPAADSTLVLMLREWTAAGYLTRDYRVLPVQDAAIEIAEVPAVEFIAEPVEAAVEQSEALAEPVEAAVEQPEALAEPVEAAADEPELVSLNGAAAKELIKIKGISPKLATAIMAGRPYESIDELIKVRGIGERSLMRIRPFLSL